MKLEKGDVVYIEKLDTLGIVHATYFCLGSLNGKSKIVIIGKGNKQGFPVAWVKDHNDMFLISKGDFK